ncbi:TetR/AcrR family transcriptional regulator [Actinomycetospora termitidis]|uniref:TetR family transcriptional regulator n=1 Tax=Actinomycetospora termitidis TaxID=3053470 RepID=A0ABT7M2F1_9PSEU|nr:TetR family transcriptional regulator [Actinomycetospora sp. Odt1-22]MDL5154835.1 TetR family transcriptional regulator [Actinomycetospora sp. Odt1-22]
MPPDVIADGRRRKGATRRRELLEATLRLVARDGVGGVSQRRVADEAGVPASAVLYYFASVDELLVSTLAGVNDRYIAGLEAEPSLAGLATTIASSDRAELIAEYDLFLLAARRDDLRGEVDRWDAALRAVADRLAPERPEVLVAAVNGLWLQAAVSGVGEDEVMRVLTGAAGAGGWRQGESNP